MCHWKHFSLSQHVVGDPDLLLRQLQHLWLAGALPEPTPGWMMPVAAGGRKPGAMMGGWESAMGDMGLSTMVYHDLPITKRNKI